MLTHACGRPHPSLARRDRLAILDDHLGSKTPGEVLGHEQNRGLPAEADRAEIARIMGAAEAGPVLER